MTKREQGLLMAAVAGITMGLNGPAFAADDMTKAGEVKCWGINADKSKAKCGVSESDVKAFKALLGEKEYEERFGKTTLHGCGSSAKCGTSGQVLNWMSLEAAECKAKGGYLVEEEGTGDAKKKVAKKA
jgi:hypothetical protein